MSGVNRERTMLVARPTVARLVALMIAGAALGTSAFAWGQDRGGRGRGERPAPSGSTSSSNRESAAQTEEVAEGRGDKVKVFRFSGFDISGRLKSPQLLYFLNRMRAEFDRPRLPHRSFIPELERSAHGKAF
jgi:hypothetical protein